MRIALLEDDAAQLELIKTWGTEAGHSCYGFSTGKALREAFNSESFDMLVADWNLPDTSGVEIVRWVRETIGWDIPVLFITSRDLEEDTVTALDAGADDYMTKPVQRMEVLARLRALSRRGHSKVDINSPIELPPYTINTNHREITLHQVPVKLTSKEYELALLLFQNVGRLFSRAHLMEKVWGVSAELNTRTVDTHISRVRSKLAIRPDNGWRLTSVYHHGYRLESIG
jgi:DNA-binding response OmpR family regulator